MSPAILIVVVLAFLVVTGIFERLWNATCPDIFRLPEITYWQALRLLIMAAILFGGAHVAFQGNGSISFGF